MTPQAILADPDFGRLKQFVIDTTGLGYFSDKDPDLAQRVSRRAAANHVRTCAAYLSIVESTGSGKQELDALIAELTIGETYFFRQNEHFRALAETVFPDLIRRNEKTRRLRIWSAGCATGAEPYSIALMLHDEFADGLAGWDISILGTDINRKFLAHAQEGRFADWAFRECPAEVRARAFVREGKDWVIRPEYKTWVSFAYHNLAADPAPSLLHGICAFDLILCRNVMIYFGPALVRTTADRLYHCLVDGGWLLVGHAEPNGEVYRAFRTVWNTGCTLYHKGAEHAEDAPPSHTPWTVAPEATQPEVLAAAPVEQDTAPPDLRALADAGRWDEALAACRALLERDRLNPGVHFTHALLLEQAGTPEEAERALQRAIYLDRNFALAHYHLGLALQRKGRTAQARRSFHNALRLLGPHPNSHPIPHGDGMTASDLADLVKIQLEVLPA